MIVAGIDPGLTGGVALVRLRFDDQGPEAAAAAMPVRAHFSGRGTEVDVRLLRHIFKNPHELFGGIMGPERLSLVVIEQAGNLRKGGKEGQEGRVQGASSMFAFGDGFGAVRTTADLCGLSVVFVRPQAWQKRVLAGMDRTNPKAAALSFVTRRFPHVNLLKSSRSTKPHKGMVDALCLAEYARHQFTREGECNESD
jgi:hypothetical protein